MEAIQIRLAQENDRPFIFSNWLRHYKNRSYFAKRIRNTVFYKWHHMVVENILNRPTTQIFIAHPPSEPEVILGFMASESVNDGAVIHFIYIKPQFKRMGIAKRLFKDFDDKEPIYFTHWTFDLDELIHKVPNLIYDPYRI
jgi:ribosomal protein S18 acetylase RimI-like enzyme